MSHRGADDEVCVVYRLSLLCAVVCAVWHSGKREYLRPRPLFFFYTRAAAEMRVSIAAV